MAAARTLQRGARLHPPATTAFIISATGVTFWAILDVSVAIMRLQSRETPDRWPQSPGEFVNNVNLEYCRLQ